MNFGRRKFWWGPRQHGNRLQHVVCIDHFLVGEDVKVRPRSFTARLEQVSERGSSPILHSTNKIIQGRGVAGDGGRVQGGAHMFWRSADEGRAVDEPVNRGAADRVGISTTVAGPFQRTRGPVPAASL